MKFKLKKNLTSRQLYRAKFGCIFAIIMVTFQYCYTEFKANALDDFVVFEIDDEGNE